MPKISEGQFALGGLFAFALWIFVVLPFLYGPPPRFADRPEQSPPHHQTQPSKTENQHGPTGDAPTNPVANKKQSEGQHEGKWYNTFLEHTPDWFVAIFTAILTYVTYRLVKSTNKLWEAGERQIKIAQIATRAAERSATVAERTMVLNDRPWVEIKVELTDRFLFSEEGCSVGIRVTLKNVGRSPAIKTGYFFEFCPSVNDAIDKHHKMIDVANHTLGQAVFGETLFPDGHRTYKFIDSISREAMTAAMASDEKEFGLYVVFCAYYGLPTGGRFRSTSAIRAIIRKDGEAFVLDYPTEVVFPLDRIELTEASVSETT